MTGYRSHKEFLEVESCIMTLADKTNIDEWEKWFELSYEPTWSLEDRVDRLIYTFNSHGFFTPKFLKEQAKIFTNGEIEIFEDFSKYHFTIQFTSIIGTPPNLDNFKKMVNVNKPVHLTFDIKFRYRTWGELKVKTWDSLKVNTWEEIRSKGVI
ncbi:YmfQ family protein [Fusobacterium perfoetens]|uniref:YmfQ family protein n=1 Tax=Fusobacterium perfoetens TaxID=852 RepID=UPI001F19DEFE|nr:YmfQ family protein [Fusobacterium perfoetens]MCF2612974.1 DUF2313 domain-containing protein [Fusobacterium perfoetens]